MSKEDATIVPVANPAALGLVAFGLTTILLSLINAGVLPSGGGAVVIPLALAFGGLMQIFAGAFEFRLGNTFGMTAFFSYGAFWWWFGLLELMAGNHWIDVSAAGATPGVALLLWGVLTLYLWISTFRLPRVTFLIFLTLWVTFGLLGLGAILGDTALSHAGGWLGVVCGSLALYASFGLLGLGAILGDTALSHAGGWLGVVCGSLALYASFGLVTNATFGRTIVPLGLKPFLS